MDQDCQAHAVIFSTYVVVDFENFNDSIVLSVVKASRFVVLCQPHEVRLSSGFFLG